MRSTLLALAAAVTVIAGGAARADVVVNISKSQQRLAVVVNGSEAYLWPVSTGRRGYATPSGVFRPVRMERHWYSRKYDNSPMPWSVFFYRGYAVHGTMEAYRLGHAASHGCVRLRPDHARTLFGLIRRAGAGRTRIVVLNGPLPHLRQLPRDVPMAEAAPGDANQHFATAPEKTETRPIAEHLSARAHPTAAASAPRSREVAHYVVSRGSDEARILRERDAWLRSIDRKYGIVR
jgi:hypothetical protein